MIGEPGQDLALANAFADSEAGSDSAAKSDIGELADVHMDDEPQTNGDELVLHLAEEDQKLTDIKVYAWLPI